MNRHAWLPLGALSLGAFAFVTTETLPIGLLPQIGGSLGSSLPLTGLLVTVYAFTVALTAAPLTALTARIPRGRLLLLVLLALVATNVAAGLAPTYAALFGARLVNAAAHGVFWSVVSSCAVRLVPPGRRGLALAAIFGGVSIATVMGVPAATFVGQHLGWRIAFFTVAGAGTVVLAVAAFAIRDDARSAESSVAHIAGLLRRGSFRALLMTTVLVVLGQFVAYTYVVPYLEGIADFPAAATAPLLLLFGVAGLFGNLAAGAIANRNPFAASVAATATIAVAIAGLAWAGPHRAAAALLLAVWGFGAGGLAVGVQTRVLALAPEAPDLASALFAGAFNVGIGGGALLGGGIVGSFGLARVVPVGAALALIALAVQLAAVAGSFARGRRTSPSVP
jgi:predicted MFS family arabinose efflux permease